MVTVSVDDIDNHIDAIDQLPEVLDAMGIGEKEPSGSSSNEEIEGVVNQIEKGGKLERND